MRRILVVLLAWPLFGNDGGQPLQVANTERMDFAPAGIIHVNGSFGDLHVDAWDRPEVEITVTKSVSRSSESKERQQSRLDSIRITTERKSPAELTISTTLASRHGDWSPPLPSSSTNGVTAEYEIHVPSNSRLSIQHGTGSVFVSGVTGDIEASARRGDILLMLPDSATYSVDAKTKFGSVSSDVEGSVRSEYLIGQRFAQSPPTPARRLRLRLRMGFGGITIKTVPPEAMALAPQDKK